MKLEKDFGATAAEEIEKIEEELNDQLSMDSETENNRTTDGSVEEEFCDDEKVKGGPTSQMVVDSDAFSKKGRGKVDKEVLKEDVRNLFRELKNGARELIEMIRKNVPDKKCVC